MSADRGVAGQRMTALLAAALLGSTVFGQAQADEPSDETVSAAAEAGVPVDALLGAMSSTGLAARTYLIGVGELAAPVHRPTGRLACIAYAESRNNPNATNPQSGAAGLFQFLPSTWRTTPQGRAGLSVYDPVAATSAAEWMVAQGRIREWSVVTMGIC